MNLLEMVTQLGARIGSSPQDPANYSYLVNLINSAAEELWISTDLPNTLREQVFESSADAPLRVTLPPYVGTIRGFRDYITAIPVHDLRPRYMVRPWPVTSSYVWQTTGDMAINREISNALTPVLQSIGVVDEAFTVTIIGQTSTADNYIATYTHAADGTVTQAVANFTRIYKIYKSAATAADVTLTVDGTAVCVIPSWATTARYQAVQLYTSAYQDQQMYGAARRFECLYKEPYMQMNFDESIFQVEGYDLAIVWFAQALHWEAGTDAEKAAALAPLYRKRGDELVRKRMRDVIQTRELIVQFGEPRFDTARLRNLRRNRWNNYAGH